MSTDKSIVAFEKHKIRRLYDENDERWFFSVIDVVGALTDSVNPRDYWFKMKIRVKSEDGFQLSTICRQLKQETGKNVVTGENFLPPLDFLIPLKKRMALFCNSMVCFSTLQTAATAHRPPKEDKSECVFFGFPSAGGRCVCAASGDLAVMCQIIFRKILKNTIFSCSGSGSLTV